MQAEGCGDQRIGGIVPGERSAVVDADVRRQAGSGRDSFVNIIKTVVLIAALSGVVSAQARLVFSPPLLVKGDLPGPPPPNLVGGGEVLIEAIIDRGGNLTRPVMLRTSPPFTGMVLDVIGKWKFSPARAVGPDGIEGPVEAGVLIGAVYRPPTLMNGPTIGNPPRDLAIGSADVPYPVAVVSPPYPPQALSGSTVLFEVTLDETGQIKNVRAISSDPGFDSAAREALAQWKFRPSSYRGRPAPATAYVLFGFSPPVVPAPAPSNSK
jgi:TonB family protein